VIDLLGETDSIDEQMFSTGAFNGQVEFVTPFAPHPGTSHVVFDFDGTLSWLRHGWPGIMKDLFREFVPPKSGESEDTLQELLLTEILALNGQPSICQMQRCGELARERQSQAPAAEILLAEYQRRLDHAIAERIQSISQGSAARDDFVVHGARPLLDSLQQRGFTLIILSGTVEHLVKREAELLALAPFFGAHIYGSRADLARWSKGEVLDRLVKQERIEGQHLLSFGDGPVEIRLTRQAGGFAVGVASDEERNGSGKMDLHKRRQLIEAGAHMLIADYRDAVPLLQGILGR
jgi:phosphoglycolate phosphatase